MMTTSIKQIQVRIWLVFILFLSLCIWAVSYFQQQSRQLLGSNFTALAIDITQAQEDVHLLKRSLYYLETDSPFFDVKGLKKVILRIQYRSPLIDRKIRDSTIEDFVYADSIGVLSEVNMILPTVNQQIVLFEQDKSTKNILVKQLTQLELDLALTYDGLHYMIQTASDVERRLKTELTFLIWGLIATILVVVSALLFALIRLYQHKEILIIQNNRDHLTQLPNRRFITEKAQTALLNRPKKIGFAILDLDFFKKINDLYGHPAGDEVLKVIANILEHSISAPSFVARLGGEEFCILFLDKTQNEAIKICEEIRQTVEQTKIKVNNSALIHITLSTGLYHHEGERQTTFSQIYQYADQALYLAKKQGRNKLVLHDNNLEF
jgi:diguanylate cyclase (GGDEF)-like protein